MLPSATSLVLTGTRQLNEYYEQPLLKETLKAIIVEIAGDPHHIHPDLDTVLTAPESPWSAPDVQSLPKKLFTLCLIVTGRSSLTQLSVLERWTLVLDLAVSSPTTTPCNSINAWQDKKEIHVYGLLAKKNTHYHKDLVKVCFKGLFCFP